MEKFHLDALSVCSRQVLKETNPKLSHYQKPNLNLLFVQMWKIPALDEQQMQVWHKQIKSNQAET